MPVVWKRKGGVTLGVLAAVVLTGCIQFAPPEDLSISGVTSLADVTGDGTADLLVDDGASLVRVEYCGTGCLHAKQAFSGQHVQFIADFNGDGVADVLTSELVSPGNSTERVLFGGANGLGDAVTVPSAPDRYISAVGDFNGDGKADLVRRGSIDSMWGRFVAYVGDGLGGFTASTLSADFPVVQGVPPELDVADIDGDGDDDLAVRVFTILAVFRLGDPPCSRATCSYISASVGGTDLAFGDIDGDSRDDFALRTSQGIVFFRSTGSGFTPFPAYQTITAPTFSVEMSLRDIDGDGVTDFLLKDTVSQRTWWSGTNDGGFPYAAVSDVPVEVSGCRYCFGDVDGDGRLDAVSGNQLWLNTSF